MFNDFNGLVVTECVVNLDFPTSDRKVKAFANITLNGAFAVQAIRVVEFANGKTIVAFPNRVRHNGSRKDTAHPINQEARLWLDGIILGEYARACRDRIHNEIKEAV